MANLRITSTLFLLVTTLVLVACGPKVKPEDTVTLYLNALKAADTKTAYSLLSQEDKTYFDIDRFKIFLSRQPQIQFLFGGSETIQRYGALREKFSYEIAEVKELDVEHVEVLVKLTLPDVIKVMEPSLTQFYLFAEETQSYSLEQTLALSRRVNSKLNLLTRPDAPVITSYQKFILQKHKGQWQILAPAWRVEAMLAEAKEKLILKKTEEAAVLLEGASNYVLKVDEVTRVTFVREAIAGKYMLRYLPRVEITKFTLQPALPSCAYPTQLVLENKGDRVIRHADVVVLFLEQQKKGRGVVGHQVISITRDFVVKQLSAVERAKQASELLDEGGKLEVMVCLKPPLHWAGLADLHVAWLELADRGF